MDSLISTGFGAKYLVPIILISSWLSNNHFKRDMSQQELNGLSLPPDLPLLSGRHQTQEASQVPPSAHSSHPSHHQVLTISSPQTFSSPSLFPWLLPRTPSHPSSPSSSLSASVPLKSALPGRFPGRTSYIHSALQLCLLADRMKWTGRNYGSYTLASPHPRLFPASSAVYTAKMEDVPSLHSRPSSLTRHCSCQPPPSPLAPQDRALVSPPQEIPLTAQPQSTHLPWPGALTCHPALEVCVTPSAHQAEQPQDGETVVFIPGPATGSAPQ